MVWAVVIADSVWPDLAHFDDPHAAVAEVFDWVTNGPPCDHQKGVGPAVLYEDTLENGLRIEYFIGTAPHAYVAIVRVRPAVSGSP